MVGGMGRTALYLKVALRARQRPDHGPPPVAGLVVCSPGPGRAPIVTGPTQLSEADILTLAATACPKHGPKE